jgi:SOUL heme-binding protein
MQHRQIASLKLSLSMKLVTNSSLSLPEALRQRRHLSGLICLAAALILLFPVKAMATEEPKYDVISTDGDFELRQYAPMVIAETWVSGTQDEASSKGFRAIAGYIFGDNKRAGAASEKIAMTAPVTMEKQNASEKIAMTAPVTMDKQGERWRMHFVMPSQYKLADLPTPNNPEVKLREVPSTKVAAIRFSGFAGEEKVATKTALLNEWVRKQGLTAANTPQLARYNAPWTPPFLRRNEVLLEVR